MVRCSHPASEARTYHRKDGRTDRYCKGCRREREARKRGPVVPEPPGCRIHGLSDWVTYKYPTGRTESRCLACYRNKTAQKHNFGPRCYRGHLKTPWTWRCYNGVYRCLTCQYERRRQKSA